MKQEDECTVEAQSINVDEDAREIILFGTVSTEMASQIILWLRQMDRAAKKNISLVISSSGGEEAGGWAIYDALCLTRSKVIGQCFGECMSIAALILQGCDTRLLSPNCRFMIHNGTATFGGPLEKIRTAIAEENLLTQLYYEKLAERSNLTVARIIEMCNNDTYMSASTAVKSGFADGILGESKKRKAQK
jgi:ATP-dependent Clp protease, protease subunit